MHTNTYIKFVNHGLANRYSFPNEEVIEMHKNLTKHPRLFRAILKHELSHTPGRYKFKDLKLDLWDGIKKPGYYKFLWNNKSTWTQFFPVWFTKEKGTVVDIGNLSNLLVFFGLLLLCLKLFLRFVP